MIASLPPSMAPRFCPGPSIVGLGPTPGPMRPVFARRPSIVGMGDFFSDVGGAISGAVSTVASNIPGLSNIINGPLKDFANTSVGQFTLNVIANNLAAAPILRGFGPAMMLVWAIPGVAKGDDLDSAIISGTVDRLKQTAQILGVDVSQVAMAQLSGLAQQLVSQFGVGNPLPAIQDIANQYGVRMDVAAIAKSQIEKLPLPDMSLFDPATGYYYLANETTTELLSHFVANEGLVLSEVTKEQTETSTATTTEQINAFKNFLPAPAAPAALATSPVVAAVAPAVAAGMSTGEKVAIGAGAAAIAGVLAWVLL